MTTKPTKGSEDLMPDIMNHHARFGGIPKVIRMKIENEEKTRVVEISPGHLITMPEQWWDWHINDVQTQVRQGQIDILEKVAEVLLNDLKDTNTLDSHRLQGRIIQYFDKMIAELKKGEVV